LVQALDESRWDPRRKKLFLFGPERMALSIERLAHYTGTAAETFQRYLLFTNYAWHVDSFRETFPDAVGPDRPGRQMPAWHHTRPARDGVTLVDIGVGPSNAKTITDHVAVLRPDLMLMIGHCGGLRNHQGIGDLVLATTYQRADGVLDHVLPLGVPVASNHRLNTYLFDAVVRRELPYRLGTVYTTANRNWEFEQAGVLEEIRLSRAIAVDMESATVAANGFRYRVPTATLLAVSDKPLHGRPKLNRTAQDFYQATRRWHLDVALEVVERVRRAHPDGLPAVDLRASDEPLLGVD
ncbi:MAG TPA: AMP nucleosidase, partial [Mycobacteriales bacterium]|nr:AMP nucleosidase [Mycobacteriales bacterium]